MDRYWIDRAEEAIKRMEGKIKDDVPELIDSFECAKRDLQKEINSFYGRYANENKISLAEAQKLLDFKELQEFKGNLKAYKKLSINSIGAYNLQLNNLSTKARITRLQALEFECDTILQRLYQQMRENIECAVTGIYTNQFYRSQFDIEQYTGFQHKFSLISDSAIKKVLAMPVQGADISTRLWRQDIDTGFKIRQTLNTMFTTGRPPQDFAKELQKIIGVRNKEGKLTGKKYEAYRLLYNESSYATNQANLDAYTADGVDEYEICAVLDSKTSQICRDMDNKHFPINKAVTGENFPPFHVFCRTTTTPYIEGLKTTRMARGLDGKSIRIKDKSYDNWLKSKVEQKAKGVVSHPSGKDNSQNTSEQFDIEKEKKDYKKFLKNVPKKNRIYLEKYFETAQYIEVNHDAISYAYFPKNDVMLYNPKNKNIFEFGFHVANTHELAHRMDFTEFHSWNNAEFKRGVNEATNKMLRNKKLFKEIINNSDDLFLSDVFSALSFDEISNKVGHPKSYWQTPGRRETEIFANIFAIESFQFNHSIEVLNEHFKGMMLAYKNILGG